ncbi:MAG TPA: hypothetical protein VKT70_09895 [Stellaceae bacterium]|nr:hypothetical protein [Stellaceae bacterium]
MGNILALLGLAVFLIGLATLIKPVRAIKIPTRARASIVLAGGFFVFIVGAVIAGGKDQGLGGVATSSVAAQPGPEIPPEEAKFVSAILEARKAFGAAANDMAKGGVRAQRRDALCKALPMISVKNWVGQIDTLSSNSEGKGVLIITIGKNVTVGTWNNSLSDLDSHTLIPADSALFQTVSALKVGDTVVFAGNFFPNTTDCVKESSITLAGSLREPQFIFRFSAVNKP